MAARRERAARPASPAGLEPLAGGACLLSVRAQPGARRAGPAGSWNGLLKIAVAAPPEGGRANEALRRELARLLGLKPAAVELAGGASARTKRFRLAARAADVAPILERLLAREELE